MTALLLYFPENGYNYLLTFRPKLIKRSFKKIRCFTKIGIIVMNDVIYNFLETFYLCTVFGTQSD